jgi:hypothetical protein
LPPGLSIFYIISLICKLIGFTSLASIYSQTPVLFSSVSKSTLFTPNSSPQSSLSIPDLFSPSEIRTFRCYKGTVTTLILNEYQQSSNSSVSSFQVKDSKMTQNAYC